MSWEFCQYWDEKNKKCCLNETKCRYSSLKDKEECDGWYFWEDYVCDDNDYEEEDG